MEDKYKVFSEQYNNLLDLVEKVDEGVANQYKKFIDSLPNVILEKLATQKEFLCDGKDFRGILEVYEDELCFEYVKYGKYLSQTVNLKPFYEDELIDEDKSEEEKENELFIFSFTSINTEDEPNMKINYIEKDGKYNYVGSKMDGIELDTEIFIEKRDGELFLTSRKTFNDMEIFKKEVQVTYQELLDCVAYEEEGEYCDENEQFEKGL